MATAVGLAPRCVARRSVKVLQLQLQLRSQRSLEPWLHGAPGATKTSPRARDASYWNRIDHQLRSCSAKAQTSLAGLRPTLSNKPPFFQSTGIFPLPRAPPTDKMLYQVRAAFAASLSGFFFKGISMVIVHTTAIVKVLSILRKVLWSASHERASQPFHDQAMDDRYKTEIELCERLISLIREAGVKANGNAKTDRAL